MTPEEFCYVQPLQNEWAVYIAGMDHYIARFCYEKYARQLCEDIRNNIRHICAVAVKNTLQQILPPDTAPEHIICTLLDKPTVSVQKVSSP